MNMQFISFCVKPSKVVTRILKGNFKELIFPWENAIVRTETIGAAGNRSEAA